MLLMTLQKETPEIPNRSILPGNFNASVSLLHATVLVGAIHMRDCILLRGANYNVLTSTEITTNLATAQTIRTT